MIKAVRAIILKTFWGNPGVLNEILKAASEIPWHGQSRPDPHIHSTAILVHTNDKWIGWRIRIYSVDWKNRVNKVLILFLDGKL